MPQLDVSNYFSQIFWLILCLVLLYYSFKNYFIPRLEHIVLVRVSKFERMVEEIKDMEIEIALVERNYKDEIKKAYVKANKLQAKYLSNFEEKCKLRLAKMEEEHEIRLNKAKEELENHKKIFIAEIPDELEKLSNRFIEKINNELI